MGGSLRPPRVELFLVLFVDKQVILLASWALVVLHGTQGFWLDGSSLVYFCAKNFNPQEFLSWLSG